MMLSVIHPAVRSTRDGRPYQVTKEDYILVHHLTLRGTWALQDSAYFTPLRRRDATT